MRRSRSAKPPPICRPGRKLVLSSGLFEVPDTAPHEPPARVHFKLDGPVPAAAELLAMDRLRDVSRRPFDPATTRGTMSAQVSLGDAAEARSAARIDQLRDRGRRHQLLRRPHDHGAKVDAAMLQVSANTARLPAQGRRQDRRRAGQSRIPQGARRRDGRHPHSRACSTRRRATISVSIRRTRSAAPFRSDLTGRVAHHRPTATGRFAVEADLTSAQIDGFLPGWVKPAGKPARATFTLTTKPQSIRIDDLVIEGAGGGVKGAIEFDGSGDLQSANFPAYGFSDGDRASLKVDRAPDGALRVIMRGEVYDGRGFIKTLDRRRRRRSQPANGRRRTSISI